MPLWTLAIAFLIFFPLASPYQIPATRRRTAASVARVDVPSSRRETPTAARGASFVRGVSAGADTAAGDPVVPPQCSLAERAVRGDCGEELRDMAGSLLLMNDELTAGGGGFSTGQLDVIINFLKTFYIPKLNASKKKKDSFMMTFYVTEIGKVFLSVATVVLSGLLQKEQGLVESGEGAGLVKYGLTSIAIGGGVQTIVTSLCALFQPRERAMLHLMAATEMELVWNSFIWSARVSSDVFEGQGGVPQKTKKYNFWAKDLTAWTAFQGFAGACINAASLSKRAEMEVLDEE